MKGVKEGDRVWLSGSVRGNIYRFRCVCVVEKVGEGKKGVKEGERVWLFGSVRGRDINVIVV